MLCRWTVLVAGHSERGEARLIHLLNGRVKLQSVPLRSSHRLEVHRIHVVLLLWLLGVGVERLLACHHFAHLKFIVCSLPAAIVRGEPFHD